MKKIIINKDLSVYKKAFRETCFGIVERNNKILCIKDKNKIELIGGGIEANESKEECLKREFKEETGLIIKSMKEFIQIDCFFKNLDNEVVEILANFFIVETEENKTDSIENFELIELSIEELISKLNLPYQKEAIKEYLQHKSNIF